MRLGSVHLSRSFCLASIDAGNYAGSMSFLGSKAASGAYQVIIAEMPPHDTYIETHLGTGAVMRRKAPPGRSIGIDIDAGVLERFSCDYPVELYQHDCVQFLKAFDFAAAGRVLLYCDPPYLEATRTSAKRYKYDYANADHKRLLAFLSEVPAMVMISGYPSTSYDVWLRGWRTVQFQVMTRGGVRTEKIWMNYAATEKRHWSRYAGKNFTDRQRINRKAERWATNYRDLPPGERLAILSALLAVEGETSSATHVNA